MGLRCFCRATGTAEGTLVIENITLPVSITAAICPNCTPGSSFLTVDVTLLGAVEVDLFSSVSFVGLPICESGVLTIEVEGNLNPVIRTALIELNIDVPADPIPFELTLNAEGEICLVFPSFGLLNVCANGSVTVEDC